MTVSAVLGDKNPVPNKSTERRLPPGATGADSARLGAVGVFSLGEDKAVWTVTGGWVLLKEKILLNLDGVPDEWESVDMFRECKGSIDRGGLPKSHDCLGKFDATGDEGDSMMQGRLTRRW